MAAAEASPGRMAFVMTWLILARDTVVIVYGLIRRLP